MQTYKGKRSHKTEKIKRWLERIREGVKRRKELKPPDYVILVLTLFFIAFGLLMVLNSSVVFSFAYFGQKYKFLFQQLAWISIGAILMFITYKINYRIYNKITIPLLIITAIFLIIVIIFGKRVYGAQRWIDLVTFSVQPSELSKLTFILYLSSWLSKKREYSNWKQYITEEWLPFIFTLSIIAGLIIGGRDMGTAMTLTFIALYMYFISARNSYQKKGFILMLSLIILLSSLMILTSKYRLERVKVYLDLLRGNIRNPDKEGYQITQVLIAIGAGGLFGRGFTESLQKYDLVETSAATDSIIAIIGEELGFVFLVTLCAAYLFFTLRAFKISSKSPDIFGALTAAGIGLWVSIQAFINISANIGLIPLTGVPLPFISYGGSSIVTLMTGIGILLNISRYTLDKQ